jgi:hypothetical protein
VSEIKPSMHVKDMVLFEDVLVNAEALACARLYGPDTTAGCFKGREGWAVLFQFHCGEWADHLVPIPFGKTRGQITRKWNRLCFYLQRS